jgi:hypothetical protein
MLMAIANTIQIGIRIKSLTTNLFLLGKRKSIGVTNDTLRLWIEQVESVVHSTVTTHG